jgi:hypothetical protein
MNEATANGSACLFIQANLGAPSGVKKAFDAGGDAGFDIVLNLASTTQLSGGGKMSKKWGFWRLFDAFYRVFSLLLMPVCI